MDIASVTYRGVALDDVAFEAGQPLSGLVLNEARYEEIDGFGYREKRSLDDGFDYGRVFLEGRTIRLRGTIYALTKAELHDRMRLVRRLFGPTLAYLADPVSKGMLPLDFTIPTADVGTFPTGLIPLRAYARPSSQPGGIFLREASNGDPNRGFSEPYEVTLECADPRLYSQTETEVVCTDTSGSGTTTHKGDYPAPLDMEIVLSGATSGPRTITLTGFGSRMTVTVPNGGATRTVRIDGKLRIATLITSGVETLRMDLVTFDAGYTWPRVVPGANAYDWTSTGGAKSTGSRFWYREAFV